MLNAAWKSEPEPANRKTQWEEHGPTFLAMVVTCQTKWVAKEAGHDGIRHSSQEATERKTAYFF